MFSVYCLLFFEVSLFLIAILFIGNDIMAPSVMITVMFIISTIFVLLNVDNWNVELSQKTVLIILSGIATFILTEIIVKTILGANTGVRYNGNEMMSIIRIQPFLFVIILLIDAYGLRAYMRQIADSLGVSVGWRSVTMFAQYRRFGVAKLARGDVLQTGGLTGQLIKFIIAQGYVALYILLNNVIVRRKLRNEDIFPTALVVISVVPSLMSAGRNQILMLLSGGLIVYYILWHERNGWRINLSWKFIRIGILILLIGVPLFYYSLKLIGRSTNRTILEYASAYAGGSIVLFNKYLSNPTTKDIWGEETFYGITKVLGYLGMGRVSRVYNLETRSLGIGGGNVYTFFRRPLHDFGMMGMYLFTVFVAIIYSVIYYAKIKSGAVSWKRKKYWVLLYMYIYYGVVLFSIDNYSQSYLSVGTVIIVGMIFALFWLVDNVKVVVNHGKRA